MKELLNFMKAAKDLHDNWHENYNVGYPFQKSFDEVVFDIYNWFQVAHRGLIEKGEFENEE